MIKTPDYILELYKKTNKVDNIPNIINTNKISKEGVDNLLKKNKLVWENTLFNGKNFLPYEGLISWGTSNTQIYFIQDDDGNYNLFLLTDDTDSTIMLLVGLNKYFIS